MPALWLSCCLGVALLLPAAQATSRREGECSHRASTVPFPADGDGCLNSPRGFSLGQVKDLRRAPFSLPGAPSEMRFKVLRVSHKAPGVKHTKPIGVVPNKGFLTLKPFPLSIPSLSFLLHQGDTHPHLRPVLSVTCWSLNCPLSVYLPAGVGWEFFHAWQHHTD